jgi:hypothetical protein
MQADELKRRITKERDGRVYPADLRRAIVEYGVWQRSCRCSSKAANLLVPSRSRRRFCASRTSRRFPPEPSC